MGKTLLLADDSVTIQKVVGISFASEDIAITTVDNGDDAISRARELRPDLILADVVMPGKSGYEVCEAIKADPELRHIPVLLLTGTFEAFDDQRAASAGASGHVAKPFEAQTLVSRVKELLAQAPSAPPVAAPSAAPAQTAPADIPAASVAADDAFDFFDDPVSSEPAPEVPQFIEPERAELEIEDPDAAFAFGEDEFAESVSDAAPATSLPNPPSAAHTIAILPDDTSPSDSAHAGRLDPLAAVSGSQAIPSTTPAATPPDSFDDLEFEDTGSGTPVSGDALAESTLLDPGGDSAFDVSASVLDGPVGGSPAPGATEAAAMTQLLDTPFPGAESALGGEPSPPAPVASIGRDPVMEMLGSDPVDSGPRSPSAAVVEELPTDAPGRASDPTGFGAPDDILEPAVAAWPEPVAEARPDVPEMAEPAPEPIEPVFEPIEPAPEPIEAAPEPIEPAFEPIETAFEPIEPAPEPIEATPEPIETAPEPIEPAPEPIEAAPEPIETAPEPIESVLAEAQIAEPLSEPTTIDTALEQIAPALREQLHETLEKIAWEAFGQVTEKIVEQAVERLEKIAWEVVPKLAETLIQEEIRKLKNE